ncbi:phosphatase PAP2 family protein [Candidatus Nanohaloarchaea archaeon]|nr:phosphatase PAP2 family protein [Candidatus Nanohaloarchaea archaeon]
MSLNEALFLKIQGLTGIGLIDQTMLLLAEALVLLVPLSLIYLWFQGRERKEDALFTFYTSVLTIGIAYVMSLLYFHENPSATYSTLIEFHAENSFPSQHTAAVFGTAFPLIYRNRERLGWLLTAAAVLTGFARIYVGEHWPVDILGSIAAAAIGLGVAYISWDRLEPAWSTALDLYEKIEKEALSKASSLL